MRRRLIPPSRLPAPLHRLGLRIAHALRKLWWRLCKPQIVGVNVIIRNARGQWLLVRHSYEGRSWTLPGGGLMRGELPAAAAERELREELGSSAGELIPIGVNVRNLYGARCVTHLYLSEATGEPRPDGREVTEAAFFDPEALPPVRSQMVDLALGMLKQH